jgi:peptidoglycan/LPS O-acetylase OafA/YrhL
MRGVAAIVIMLIHMGGLPAHVLPGGYLAVDFFFALSGFVLAHAYAERKITFGAFLRARGIRLYPLYLAGLILAAVAASITGMSPIRLMTAFGIELFFLPAPVAPDLYPLNPPAWSLFFELVANAAWFPIRRFLRGGVALTVLLIGTCAVLATDAVNGAVNAGPYWNDIAGGFARVLFSFAAGVLVYRLWGHIKLQPRPPSWLVAVALLLVLTLPMPRQVFDPIAVLILMPALVLAGASCGSAGRVSAWIQRQLGAASYAVYVLHFPVILVTDYLFVSTGFLRRLGVIHPSIVTTPLTVVLVVGLALLLDWFYDRPLRRRLSQAAAHLGAVPVVGRAGDPS